MKFKHFFVLAVAFALVALGTSCNKPSENKILGKWRTTGIETCNSINPDVWVEETLRADEVNIIEFRSNGTCISYNEDGQQETGAWSYDKDSQQLTINGATFDIIAFSSQKMELEYKYTNGELWVKTRTTMNKIK
jgi:hypothetical protein